MTTSGSRVAWVLTAVAVVAGLLWLDAHRAGPASELSRCNLALTRSEDPPADVLVVGSSRTGVAIDPIAMQAMLGAAGIDDAHVERLALARNPLRANSALVDNYLANRGAPRAIVLELSFLTERTVERINGIAPGTSADAFLYRRDVNLIDFSQIVSLPAVARPFSEDESTTNRARFALEGVVTRSGALAYEAANELGAAVTTDECSKERWTREPEWPDDFAFSWDDAEIVESPSDRILALRNQILLEAGERELQPWQLESATGVRYPYDLDAPHRQGEMELLDQVVERAAADGVPVLLLPLTLYGTSTAPGDVERLNERYAGVAHVFDLYEAAGVDLSTHWYDDAHLEIGAASELTTAVLAQYLLDQGLLAGDPSDRAEP